MLPLTKSEKAIKLENEERNKELQEIEEAKNIIIKAENSLENKRLHNLKNPHDRKDLTVTEKILAGAKETLDTLEKNRKYVFKKSKKSLKKKSLKKKSLKKKSLKKKSLKKILKKKI